MSEVKKIGVIDVNLEGCKGFSRKDIDKIFREYSEKFRDDLEAEILKAYPPKKKEQKKEGQ